MIELPKKAPAWDKKEILFLSVLFFSSLSARLIYLWRIKDYPFMSFPSGQPEYFLGKAFAIARGDLWAGQEPFFYAPFYFYFLAFVKLFSSYQNILFNTFALQCVIGSLNGLLHYALARLVFNRKVAVIAALMAFFYCPYIFFECDPVEVSIVIFMINLVFLLLLRFPKTGKLWPVALGGIFSGLSILARPNMIPAWGLSALWLLCLRPLSLKKRITGACLFGLAVCLCILPVTLTNYIKSKEFILISANGAVNFYIGNNRDAVGYFDTPSDMPWLNSEKMHYLNTALASVFKKDRLTYGEVHAYLMNKTWGEIKADPLRWARLLAVKLYLVFYKFEMPNPDFYYFRIILTPYLKIFFLSFGIIAPLGLAGIVFSRKTRETWLIILVSSGYAVTLIMMFVSQRYRMPLVPPLILFAAWFVVHLFEILRSKSFRQGIIRIGVCLFFFMICSAGRPFLQANFNLQIPTPAWDTANGFHVLALGYKRMGDMEKYQESEALSRKYSKQMGISP